MLKHKDFISKGIVFTVWFSASKILYKDFFFQVCQELDLEEGRNPSRVLFVRFLPRDVTEHEIAILAVPFGPISNLVLTRKNGQVSNTLTFSHSSHCCTHYKTCCRRSF